MPARDLYWLGIISGDGSVGLNWAIGPSLLPNTDPPASGDSLTFDRDPTEGGRNKMTAGPGTLSLVAVTAVADYGAGTICYAGMTVGTLTLAGQKMTGGTVANAILSGNTTVTGGTFTGSIAWSAEGDDAYISDDAAIMDVSGCAITAATALSIYGHVTTSSLTTSIVGLVGVDIFVTGWTLTFGSIAVAPGGSFDANTGELTLAGGLFHGGGTIKDVAAAAAYRAAEGIIDGGGNTGITFQRGKTGTACTTGTAT